MSRFAGFAVESGFPDHGGTLGIQFGGEGIGTGGDRLESGACEIGIARGIGRNRVDQVVWVGEWSYGMIGGT